MQAEGALEHGELDGGFGFNEPAVEEARADFAHDAGVLPGLVEAHPVGSFLEGEIAAGQGEAAALIAEDEEGKGSHQAKPGGDKKGSKDVEEAHRGPRERKEETSGGSVA